MRSAPLGRLARLAGVPRSGGAVLVEARAELDAPLPGLLDDGERAGVEQLGGLRQADPPLAEELEHVPDGTGVQQLSQGRGAVDLLFRGP